VKRHYQYSISYIQEAVLSPLRSMYEHNELKIRLNNEVTQSVQISKGVGQGCPVTQTLFNIYIKNSFRMEDTIQRDKNNKNKDKKKYIFFLQMIR